MFQGGCNHCHVWLWCSQWCWNHAALSMAQQCLCRSIPTWILKRPKWLASKSAPFFLFFFLKQQQQLRILFMLCINYESSRYSLKGLTGFSYWSGAACAQGLRVCYLCVSHHWKTNFRTCKSNNSHSWSLQWAFIWWENDDISEHRCPRAAAVEWKLWVKTKFCLLSNFIKLKMSCSDPFN